MLLLIIVVAFTTVICVFAARGVGTMSEFTISYISPYCFLVDGADVNVAMKQVINSRTTSATTNDSTIQHIVFDFWEDGYDSMFNWDTGSSKSVDATANANIRLFYTSSTKTMYVLSMNLIAANNCSSMLRNFTALQSVDFKNFNSIQSTTHENMFYGDTALQSILHPANLSTNLSATTKNMFYGCTSLMTVDTSKFRTETITTMSGMFKNCSSLTSLSTSDFDVEKVTDFSEMFSGCSNLASLDLSNFTTSAATTMKNMLYNCSSLTSLDVSNFKTTNVTNFEGMFDGCSGLTSLDLSSFNSVNATTFKNMFNGCSSLATLNISNFTSEGVTDMTQMFAQTAISTLDASKFDTGNVTLMDKMFYNMPNITTIYASNLWTTINVTSATDMFTNDADLVGGFGTTYTSSHTGLDYAHVDVPDGPGYLTAADVQYKGVFISDEFGVQLSISYVGTESPYTLPNDSEYDHFTSNSVNYQPGATVNYSIFDGVESVEFVAYYKKGTLTFTNDTNGSYVTRSATYSYKGHSGSVSSGSRVPYGATVTITVSTNSTNYKNPTFAVETASGKNVSLTTISQYEQYSFVMPTENATAKFTCTYSGFCVAEGTLITLADGTQKAVEDITLADKLLIMNHETGCLEECEINFIEYDGRNDYEIVNLVFENGTTCRIIDEHGLFDKTLGKYVYIHADDYNQYLGHTFCVLSDADEISESVLTDAFVSVEHTGCYSLTTKYHLNYFIDGVLSMPGGIYGLFNIFEFDENLQYNQTDKENSIEEFGLFTYEDFEGYITYEQFCLYPAAYLKVALGKGLITWERIEYLIERYCS